MKITQVMARAIEVPLTRPYAIAGHRFDAVGLLLFEVANAHGGRGYGQASPAPAVTGETLADCTAQLVAPACDWLLGRDSADPTLLRDLEERCPGPAARAAIDMALLVLGARAAGRPLVEQFGRVHAELPTSITIGLKSVAETLAEAEEYAARGFVAIKVKTGADVDEDIERLQQLRRRFGVSLTLRADANMGYDERALRRFIAATDALDLEMLEQPVPCGGEALLRTLPAAVRRRLVADESVRDEADLAQLLHDGCPYGIVNIKLMKCGGPRAAMRLAQRCAEHGIEILWGCMDESALGIAAALHTACACPATRYLDLDGSFDLAADPFLGGFDLRAGRLATLPRPGLGALPA